MHQARALAASLRAHHESALLHVLLADRVAADCITRWREKYSAEYIDLVTPDQLPGSRDDIERMCFWYTPFELCCALRGLLHQYLWQQTDAAQWIFLDADIFVVAPLDLIFEQLQTAIILLTPHRRNAPGVQHAATLENSLLNTGLYNAGFLGVRRCDETERFIDWFASRLYRYASDDQNGRGWFVDQLWLDLAPHYFRDVQCVQSAGANVGHWNLFDAQLDYDAEANQFFVDGERLLFFHFSGWQREQPFELSKHARPSEKLSEQNQAAWKVLAEQYASCLAAFDETETTPYSFANFADGRPITLWMRRHYWELHERNEVPFSGSPFSQPEYFHRAAERVKPTLLRKAMQNLKGGKQ
jgi:hypothetical protein